MGHRYHFFVAIANALEPLQLKRGGAFVMVYRADDDAALHSVTTTAVAEFSHASRSAVWRASAACS
jgi:hypothetical protein